MLTSDSKIQEYCIQKSNRPSKTCKDLENYTKKNVPYSQMLIGELEASFLGFLLRSIKATNVLEFGTFTGYSSLCMAENLPDDGLIITLDINPETVEIAKNYWKGSTHGHKIQSIIGPALETVKNLDKAFDFIFIDADKINYLDYLKAGLKVLSPKGMIAIDNVLWSGKVLDQKGQDQDTLAIQNINNFISESTNLYGTLLPVRDGIFLIQKLD
ncbi:MAG: methyltransferase [Halobacteriovoraceae bacterium]|nr:methyltransferase [Halobacteriovoraceae bacterium]